MALGLLLLSINDTDLFTLLLKLLPKFCISDHDDDQSHQKYHDNNRHNVGK